MQKEEKKEVVKKLRELFSSRDEFFSYLDSKVSKVPNTDVLDFGDKELKEIYAKFYSYDYSIRKLLPYLYKAYEIKI
ncbi:MAG: CmeU family protein [Campylobacter ureolyticus]|uniref:CmeU family protein n=1 Tax=Campylobacter ureolyticus TaxID=827 RepID=UPI0022B2F19B|nr:CmeU family protein [Campylobacter ureolyticus]MCZ6102849.1 CmeU family protein [Campylobacter ureolyticus]MDU4981138.1 CmeU family protein [Campylobacter ureolyticus]